MDRSLLQQTEKGRSGNAKHDNPWQKLKEWLVLSWLGMAWPRRTVRAKRFKCFPIQRPFDPLRRTRLDVLLKTERTILKLRFCVSVLRTTREASQNFFTFHIFGFLSKIVPMEIHRIPTTLSLFEKFLHRRETIFCGIRHFLVTCGRIRSMHFIHFQENQSSS